MYFATLSKLIEECNEFNIIGFTKDCAGMCVHRLFMYAVIRPYKIVRV